MKISELNESPDRNYVNLPKDDIERLRQKFLPDWEYKDNRDTSSKITLK